MCLLHIPAVRDLPCNNFCCCRSTSGDASQGAKPNQRKQSSGRRQAKAPEFVVTRILQRPQAHEQVAGQKEEEVVKTAASQAAGMHPQAAQGITGLQPQR